MKYGENVIGSFLFIKKCYFILQWWVDVNSSLKIHLYKLVLFVSMWKIPFFLIPAYWNDEASQEIE